MTATGYLITGLIAIGIVVATLRLVIVLTDVDAPDVYDDEESM